MNALGQPQAGIGGDPRHVAWLPGPFDDNIVDSTFALHTLLKCRAQARPQVPETVSGGRRR
jgi:hypothetical protein